MVINNIDGSAGGSENQLMVLLAAVASPDYKEKLQELQDATKKNQALLDLIAPATDIMIVRGQLAADKQASDDACSLAVEKANASIADAKVAAALLIQDAQAKADDLVNEAKEINDKARAARAELAEAMAAANAAKATADAATDRADAHAVELGEASSAAAAELASYAALKAEIIAKHQAAITQHQAFIESL